MRRCGVHNVFTLLRRAPTLPGIEEAIKSLDADSFPMIYNRDTTSAANPHDKQSDMISPEGIVILAMAKIARFSTNSDERFLTVHAFESNEKVFGIPIENWHRAWVAYANILWRRGTLSVNHYPYSRQDSKSSSAVPYFEFGGDSMTPGDGERIDEGGWKSYSISGIALQFYIESYGIEDIAPSDNGSDDEALIECQVAGETYLGAMNPNTDLFASIEEKC